MADAQGARAGGCQLTAILTAGSAFLTAGSLSKGDLKHNPCKTKLFLPPLPPYTLSDDPISAFGISVLPSSKPDNFK